MPATNLLLADIHLDEVVVMLWVTCWDVSVPLGIAHRLPAPYDQRLYGARAFVRRAPQWTTSQTMKVGGHSFGILKSDPPPVNYDPPNQ